MSSTWIRKDALNQSCNFRTRPQLAYPDYLVAHSVRSLALIYSKRRVRWKGSKVHTVQVLYTFAIYCISTSQSAQYMSPDIYVFIFFKILPSRKLHPVTLLVNQVELKTYYSIINLKIVYRFFTLFCFSWCKIYFTLYFSQNWD